MNTIANNVDRYYDSWDDNREVSNIRCRGSYPHVRPIPHKRKMPYPQTINQHKPFGMGTLCYDPFDDRPDWFRFRPRHRRRQYEEIMHQDPEYLIGMEQDHEMHMPHTHVHIRHVMPDTYDEEIGDTIII